MDSRLAPASVKAKSEGIPNQVSLRLVAAMPKSPFYRRQRQISAANKG